MLINQVQYFTRPSLNKKTNIASKIVLDSLSDSDRSDLEKINKIISQDDSTEIKIRQVQNLVCKELNKHQVDHYVVDYDLSNQTLEAATHRHFNDLRKAQAGALDSSSAYSISLNAIPLVQFIIKAYNNERVCEGGIRITLRDRFNKDNLSKLLLTLLKVIRKFDSIPESERTTKSEEEDDGGVYSQIAEGDKAVQEYSQSWRGLGDDNRQENRLVSFEEGSFLSQEGVNQSDFSLDFGNWKDDQNTKRSDHDFF